MKEERDKVVILSENLHNVSLNPNQIVGIYTGTCSMYMTTRGRRSLPYKYTYKVTHWSASGKCLLWILLISYLLVKTAVTRPRDQPFSHISRLGACSENELKLFGRPHFWSRKCHFSLPWLSVSNTWRFAVHRPFRGFYWIDRTAALLIQAELTHQACQHQG